MFVHIKNVDVAGGSTQLNVDEVFTSTYEIYKVVWTNFTVQTEFANDGMNFRLLDNSGSQIAADYDKTQLYARGFSATFLESKNTSSSAATYFYTSTASNNGFNGGVMYVYFPYSARPTFMVHQASGRNYYQGTKGVMQKGGAVLNTNALCRGFQFEARSDCGNLTSGKVSVYGLKE